MSPAGQRRHDHAHPSAADNGTASSPQARVPGRRPGVGGPSPGASGREAGGGAAVSVVICAHTEKRWHDTLAAVASVQAQRRASHEIILVVDHNPDLRTALEAELPGVIVIENSESPGLSGGKNTGAAAASGDIVAFLDDDAVAEPDWLTCLADPYSDPAVMGVGGFTYPLWATRRPSWFPTEFDWVLGCSYRGMPESPSEVRNVMGGNASFRREVIPMVGGFRSGIGRSADSRPLGCEETEFCIRLAQQAAGAVVVFDNRARIGHRVPAARERFSYFWSRCYAEGLSKAMVVASVGARHGLASERSYTLVTLPRGVVRGVAEALQGQPAGLARAGAIIAGLTATTSGYLVGWARRVSAEGDKKGRRADDAVRTGSHVPRGWRRPAAGRPAAVRQSRGIRSPGCPPG